MSEISQFDSSRNINCSSQRLIDNLRFYSKIFHLYGDVTITGGGLQNLGLCSVLGAFEQGGNELNYYLIAYLSFPDLFIELTTEIPNKNIT
jgi:hypothetical protein